MLFDVRSSSVIIIVEHNTSSATSGANWAGKEAGAISFKGSAPASLTVEHVAFLDNGVSEPGGHLRGVDVHICAPPAHPLARILSRVQYTPTQCRVTLRYVDGCSILEPVPELSVPRDWRELTGHSLRKQGGTQCHCHPSVLQPCSRAAWASGRARSRSGAWTTARSMATTLIV